MTTMYRFAMICLLCIPSSSLAQDVLLIRGTVLRGEDFTVLNSPSLVVTAARSGDPIKIAATVNNGTYEIRVPAVRATDQSIWTIEFSEDSRHPGSLTDMFGPIAGATPSNTFVHQVDKVLLPEAGPRGYQRNIEQLLEYERVWYARRADGQTVTQLRQEFQKKLLSMPYITSRTDIPEVFGPGSHLKRDLLWRKRYEVFALYGMVPPELPLQQPACFTW